jgi:hypothetical protein
LPPPGAVRRRICNRPEAVGLVLILLSLVQPVFVGELDLEAGDRFRLLTVRTLAIELATE